MAAKFGTCKDCLFFDKSKMSRRVVSKTGDCKRYPPSKWTSANQVINPQVAPDDWCGEFYPLNGYPNLVQEMLKHLESKASTVNERKH